VFEPGILQWTLSKPPDILGGIIVAVGGILGASIVVFTSIGSAMPGTEARTEYKEGQAQLAKFREQWNKAVEDKRDPETLAAIEAAWNKFRDDLKRDAGSGFAPAALIYVVIAAILATLLATSFYGGIGIGLGLTGIMSTIGTRNQKEKSDTVKNKALEDLIKEAEPLISALKAAGQGATPNVGPQVLSDAPTGLESGTQGNGVQLDRLHRAIAEAEKAKAL
jgi:hypothetical protein